MHTPENARILLDQAPPAARAATHPAQPGQLMQQTEDAHGQARIALSQLEDLHQAQRAYHQAQAYQQATQQR